MRQIYQNSNELPSQDIEEELSFLFFAFLMKLIYFSLFKSYVFEC